MTILERCQMALNNTGARYTVNSIIYNIINKYNIDRNKLLTNTRLYINTMLHDEEHKRFKIKRLQADRKEKEDLIKLIESSLIRGATPTENEQGKAVNNYKPNNVEQNMLKLCQVKKELELMIEEESLEQRRYEQDTKILRSFVDLIPQPSYRNVMNMYLDGKDAKTIARELGYGQSYVWIVRNRSVKVMAELLKQSINSKN